jgi:hypothetical protein
MHDIRDFLQSMSSEIEMEYKRIQKRALEDPGTAGDQGEENWAAILRRWLPPTYQVVTKGRIINHEGVTSPQVDVLILQPSYPRGFTNTKLYFAGGVAGAFECKLTLKAEHITKTASTAAEISRMQIKRTGTPYKELYNPIVYGLLAHSHSWKGKHSQPQENIQTPLIYSLYDIVEHPKDMLDFLCVADFATWVSFKEPRSEEKTKESIFASYFPFAEREGSQNVQVAPLGALIYQLLVRLAWEDPQIRGFAHYLSLAQLFEGIFWGGQPALARHWEYEIYSEEVRAKIVAPTDQDYDILDPRNMWNEWRTGRGFP